MPEDNCSHLGATIHAQVKLLMPLGAATDLVGDTGNLMFKTYFDCVIPIWMDDVLRTLKTFHCLSLAAIGCPSNHSLSG